MIWLGLFIFESRFHCHTPFFVIMIHIVEIVKGFISDRKHYKAIFQQSVVSNTHSLQTHLWKSLLIMYDIVFIQPCKYCANGYLSLWHSMFVLDKTFFGIRSNKWLCHKTLSTRFVISYHILPTKATKTFLFDAQLF